MLKKIGLFFAILLVVLAAGFYGLWFSAAKNAKEQIEGQLARLNTENSKFSSDGIATSGFPFYLNVSIINPHITGQIDKLIDPDTAQSIFKTNLPEWKEDYALNGSIDLSVSVFSNIYKMVFRGDWNVKSSVAGKPVNLNSKIQGDSICELKLDRAPMQMLGKMWSFASLDEQKEELWREFREVSCKGPASEYINADSGEVVLSTAGGEILISRAPGDKTSKIRFYLKSTDYEITKAGDELFAAYQSITPNSEPLNLSANGKTNIEMDFTYNGTEDWKSPDVKTLPVEFKIDKLYISSAAYQSDSVFYLSNSLDNAVRNFAINYKNEITINDSFRKILAASLVNFVKDAANGKYAAQDASEEKKSADSFASLKEKLAGFKPDELEAMVISVVPDFSYLGKITTALDAKYSGDENFTDGLLTLSSFEISTEPYGITANGEVKRSKEQLAPTGKFSIYCNNCLSMIDAADSYLQRVKSFMVMLEPQGEGDFPVTPEMVQGIKNFLQVVGKAGAENPNLLTFDIESTGAAEPTVNGKPLSEVMAIYMQNVQPKPPAQPEAKTETAPESKAEPKVEKKAKKK